MQQQSNQTIDHWTCCYRRLQPYRRTSRSTTTAYTAMA